MSDVEFDSRGLDQLIKALKGNMPMAKIGILGDKNARSGPGEATNPEIGAKHEFGEAGMPVRSFLRVPISDNLEKYLEKSGAYTEEALKAVVKAGSVKEWVKKLAIVGESIVADAFSSGGFGKWKPSNMEHKINKQTLVETQQLRNSISSQVVE